MEAWNVDLVGPFETPALGGGLYILTMRDIGSGYAEIKILENKWEATKFVTETLRAPAPVRGFWTNLIHQVSPE
jgi:hypothetical protein